jgi:hypothetical protein
MGGRWSFRGGEVFCVRDMAVCFERNMKCIFWLAVWLKYYTYKHSTGTESEL